MVVIKVFDSKGVKTIDCVGDVVDEVPYDPVEDNESCEPTSEPEEDP